MADEFRYASRGAPSQSDQLARLVSDLLVPAVTKATMDLWIATDGLDTFSYSQRAYRKGDPCEVTIVQHMTEVLSAYKVAWTLAPR